MKKYIIILISAFFIIAISFTYGKWELNTLLYGDEFLSAVKNEQNSSNALIASGINNLKVFNFSNESAEVFLEDGDENKWILNFKKDLDEKWSIRYDKIIHSEIIHSNNGGSGNQAIYWY